jgi:hypothetical protein
MLDCWRNWAREAGLPGLYFIFQKQYPIPEDPYLTAFDAQFQFQPFETMYSKGFPTSAYLRSEKKIEWLRKIVSTFEWRLNKFRSKLGLPPVIRPLNHLKSKLGLTRPTLVSYDQVWERAVAAGGSSSLTTFPGAFVDWDNTARYGNRATIFVGATPDRFKFWLQTLERSMAERHLPEDFVFLNAWNEWSEGAYLEPDETHGYRYLEAVRSVVLSSRSRLATSV